MHSKRKCMAHVAKDISIYQGCSDFRTYSRARVCHGTVASFGASCFKPYFIAIGLLRGTLHNCSPLIALALCEYAQVGHNLSCCSGRIALVALHMGRIALVVWHTDCLAAALGHSLSSCSRRMALLAWHSDCHAAASGHNLARCLLRKAFAAWRPDCLATALDLNASQLES